MSNISNLDNVHKPCPLTLADYVAHYRAQGFIPIPIFGMDDGICTCRKGVDCTSAGKHPIVKRQLAIEATQQDWEHWLQQWPGMNLGILTGSETGIFVIDIDPRHGGDESLAELETRIGPMPAAAVAVTGGGGRHFVFQIPQGVEIKNSAGQIAPGVDVRGNGGLIVVEPSRTKGAYKWL